MTRRTGLVWHETYMWHNTANTGTYSVELGVEPYRHVESPDTKRRFKNLLDASGLTRQLIEVEPRKATEQEVLRVHKPDYLARLKALNETGGDAGVGAEMGPGSYDIVLLAAGGVISLVDAVLDGTVDNGYALVRPPGHHAMPDYGLGLCLLCNGAIAGLHAIEARGLSRIAFVDWDVHHGNGTEAAFWQDPRALTISIHQDDNMLPSGAISDIGEGAGCGFNLNIPLPPGCGYGAYEAVFERVVLPALRAYQPELIIVPCGFDAGAQDPMGRQMMHSRGFHELTLQLMAVADECCQGRLVMCQEGGYNPITVPFHGLAVIEALSGIKSSIEDPKGPMFESLGGQDLQEHQEKAIERVKEQLQLNMSHW